MAVVGFGCFTFCQTGTYHQSFQLCNGQQCYPAKCVALQFTNDPRSPYNWFGLDQFLYKYSIEYVNPQAWLERFISHPHNLVFDYWLRLGIIGPVFCLVVV